MASIASIVEGENETSEIKYVLEATEEVFLTEELTTPEPVKDDTLGPDRSNCNEIRGTEYHSWPERDWFLANCIINSPLSALVVQIFTPAPVAASVAAIQEEFNAGFLAGGGSPDQLVQAHRIINCESSWNIYAKNGIYNGLGQWDSTWWSYGGGDIYSPWQQGHNMAVRVIASKSWGAWECR